VHCGPNGLASSKVSAQQALPDDPVRRKNLQRTIDPSIASQFSVDLVMAMTTTDKRMRNKAQV
jgi:hypothetical protein